MKIVFNPFLAEIPENVIKLKVEEVVEILIHQSGKENNASISVSVSIQSVSAISATKA